MAYSKGREDVRRFIKGLPAEIEAKLLRGAARAGANVIAEEARDQCESEEIAGLIKVKVKGGDGKVFGLVQVKGPGQFKAIWLEYGTDPHFISVDDSQREGRSVRRINELERGGSLVIGGTFVGKTVHHPGARAHPFMRLALDLKETAAIAAAQAYINARITPTGIKGATEPEADE